MEKDGMEEKILKKFFELQELIQEDAWKTMLNDLEVLLEPEDFKEFMEKKYKVK